MRTATLKRLESSEEGTFGVITTDSHQEWHTGELQWLNNKPFKSCIPEGTYRCSWLPSEKRGECYHVLSVPARTGIEFHPANYMGDKSKGWKSQIEGCIALGLHVGKLSGQKTLLKSRYAITEFQKEMNFLDFELVILNCF
jgi:hypothetical protein